MAPDILPLSPKTYILVFSSGVAEQPSKVVCACPRQRRACQQLRGCRDEPEASGGKPGAARRLYVHIIVGIIIIIIIIVVISIIDVYVFVCIFTVKRQMRYARIESICRDIYTAAGKSEPGFASVMGEDPALYVGADICIFPA